MPSGGRTLTTKVEFEQLARALASLVLEPVAAELRTTKDLIIVPDRALWGIPWDALRVRGKLLVERFSTSVTHSLSVLTLSRTRVAANPSPTERTRLVAFADAAYKRTSADDSIGVTRNWRAFRSGNRSFVGPSEVTDEIGRLPWPKLQSSRQEALRVSRLFPGGSDLILGEEVTPATILRMSSSGALRRYDHVLFSVHGYFDPGTPEYSALMLSPTSPTHSASALFAHQVYGLRLNSRLVFLSACSTGLGQIDTGDGLYGLPYAFLVAGNADTIATFWPVRDRATAYFVAAFYRNLRHHDSHRRALWETKRQFSRSSNVAWREPSVWAAFTLFGG